MPRTRTNLWRPSHACWATLLAAAIINVPLTIYFLLPIPWERKPTASHAGAAAAAYGWPTTTPHEKPWPAPTNVTIEAHFARRRTEAWSVEATDPSRIQTRVTHKVVDERCGWPLPCLRRTQRWWPDNSQWRLDAPWDTGVRLVWRGTLLNPLIAFAATWLIITFPRALGTWIAARRRRRQGRCPACGYPIGISAVCTECGAPVDAMRRSGRVTEWQSGKVAE